MEKPNCKNCKYFDGQCQNFNLTRGAKTKRMNGFACEYWEERNQQTEEETASLKRTLLDIAIQLEKIAYSLQDDEK